MSNLKNIRSLYKRGRLWISMLLSGYTSEEMLYARAAINTKGPIAKWWGHSGSGSKRRIYRCYICDSVIDTESNYYRPTKHAELAVEQHKNLHLAEGPLGLI